MRFFLDSADVTEIGTAARFAYVAGVTTNPLLLARAGVSDVTQVLEAAVATGRRDWKLWVQMPDSSHDLVVSKARLTSEALSALAGGTLAGPTLVAKLLPTPESLWAATQLIRDGIEVCVTGVAGTVQALSLATLPLLAPHGEQPLETEGPPASRNPHMPHAIAFYVGRAEDAGHDGVAAVGTINDLYVANGIRTRILAGSIRSREMLERLLERLARSSSCRVDVTLPAALLTEVVRHPVSDSALLEFQAQEGRPQ